MLRLVYGVSFAVVLVGCAMTALRGDLLGVQHGGPDGGPDIAWDFSSNANAVSLPTDLMARLLDADRRHYPDPYYAALRTVLAQAHGIHMDRVLPTAGSSEGIRRLTLSLLGKGLHQVWVPVPGYGDYRAAAQALGVDVCSFDPWSRPSAWCDLDVQAVGQPGPILVWLCDPCNPTGRSLDASFWQGLRAWMRRHPNVIVALDRAYEPLRLRGHSALPPDLADVCWQFHSPNKALGLTGVRAGWVQAPLHDPLGLVSALWRLAPSWVMSAEGVHLLKQWYTPEVQDWLVTSHQTLAFWMQRLEVELAQRGWSNQPSFTSFFVSQAPTAWAPHLPAITTHLRTQGLKWRDAGSLGLPGAVRLRAHEPAAQQALLASLDAWCASQPFLLRSVA